MHRTVESLLVDKMSIVPVGAKWSLMVLHQGGGHSQTITIQVSEVRRFMLVCMCKLILYNYMIVAWDSRLTC